ncbi:hypothetical protein, partial [Pantoea dispersa]
MALVPLALSGGALPVLLVVVVAQVALQWPPRPVLALALLLITVSYLALSAAGIRHPLLTTLIYAGFHAFAGLSAHYARTAEL